MRLRLPGRTPEIKAIHFTRGEWADQFGMGDNVDVVYTPTINEWQGKQSVELQLHDLRASA